jgi:hypothetical protein
VPVHLRTAGAGTLDDVTRDDLDGLLDGQGQHTDEPGYGDGVPDVCWACNRLPAGDGPSGACVPCRARLRGDAPFESPVPRSLVGEHLARPWAPRRTRRHPVDD